MSEQWKPIAGWEGRYEVSDAGHVRSLDRRRFAGRGRYATVRGCVLSPSAKDGRPGVSMYDGRGQVRRNVHRLVAEAFVPNPHNLPQVNHIDGDRSNNHASNLEWCTAKQNSRHRARVLGTQVRGEGHHWARLNEAQARVIRRLGQLGSMSYREIAEPFGTTAATVGFIVRGQSWKHLQEA